MIKGLGLTVGTLVVALVLAGCVRLAEATRTDVCAPFDKLALGVIPKTWEAMEERFDRVWESWATTAQELSRSPTAEAVFTVYTSESYRFDTPRAFDLRGTKVDGVWRIKARDISLVDSTSEWSAWRPVRIPATTGRRIDRLLANPCFWHTPRFLPEKLPLLDGREISRIHGPTTFFNVRVGERQWGGIQDSWVAGSPGGLRFLLMEAAFGAPWPVDKEMASLTLDP